MDSSEIIKQQKRKVVFKDLKDNRLTGCTIVNCKYVGSNCVLKFNSYEEKLNYDKGSKICCNCVTISG